MSMKSRKPVCYREETGGVGGRSMKKNPFFGETLRERSRHFAIRMKALLSEAIARAERAEANEQLLMEAMKEMSGRLLEFENRHVSPMKMVHFREAIQEAERARVEYQAAKKKITEDNIGVIEELNHRARVRVGLARQELAERARIEIREYKKQLGSELEAMKNEVAAKDQYIKATERAAEHEKQKRETAEIYAKALACELEVLKHELEVAHRRADTAEKAAADEILQVVEDADARIAFLLA